MTILYKLILIPEHYVLQIPVVQQEAEQSSKQSDHPFPVGSQTYGESSKIDYDVSILKLDKMYVKININT